MRKALFPFWVVVCVVFVHACAEDPVFYNHDSEEESIEEEILPDSFYCLERSSSFGDVNGYAYEDLGLTSGNLWAKVNLGATELYDYGDYYAWGELSTKKNYTLSTYRFYHSGSSEGYTKYSPQRWAKRYGYQGFYDDLSVLELSDDVAHAEMGGSWRLPTLCDYEELFEETRSEWCAFKDIDSVITGKKKKEEKVDLNAMTEEERAAYKRLQQLLSREGYLFIGKEDKWIFLPGSGYYDERSLVQLGSHGYYWTSAGYARDPNFAHNLAILKGGKKLNALKFRELGFSIRAVCPTEGP
ncbi:MAG: hypothetical protein MJZ14_10505 [Paludibacteraceae bacterium]|nr:hypothetical protein [Paludibacteraceae bacterium]